MAYEKDGRFWPTDIDKTPKVARFHVPSSTLTADTRVSESSGIEITETSEAITGRLKEDFPLYRLAKWGRGILGFEKENI